MKKLILIIGLLWFATTLSAGTVKDIKPLSNAKVSISDRVKARIEAEIGTDTQQKAKIAEGIENDTTLQEKKAVIVNEETTAEAVAFAEKTKPIELNVLQILALDFPSLQLFLTKISPQDIPKLAILIYDYGYQAREFNKGVLSMVESMKLKEVLRAIPSKQYPIVKFSFLETTNDDSAILKVEVDKWVDIKKLQGDVKSGKYKLVMLMSDRLNNCSIIELGDKVENYPLHGKEFEIAYQVVKEVNPDIPVGFITVMFPDMEKWLASFTVEPDVFLLFNCATLGSNIAKIKNRWFKDRPVILNPNHHHQYHQYENQQYGSKEYQDYVQQAKELKYNGVIWWRN